LYGDVLNGFAFFFEYVDGFCVLVFGFDEGFEACSVDGYAGVGSAAEGFCEDLCPCVLVGADIVEGCAFCS